MGFVGPALMGISAFQSRKEGKRAARQQEQQLEQQQQIQDKAQNDARIQQRRSAEAVRNAEQKQPDVGSILESNRKQGGGVGSTLLTGPQGIDAKSLTLGKKTLLGG